MKYHVKTQMWLADVWSSRQSETRFENLCWGANILIWSFNGEKAPVLLINGSVITHYTYYFLSQRLICFMYVFSAIHSSFIGERKFHSTIAERNTIKPFTLQWRHNERNGVSNHLYHDCLLNHLFGRRAKKTSKFHVTGFCGWNSPVTGEFPAQRTSNTENVSIWWRHHVFSSSV